MINLYNNYNKQARVIKHIQSSFGYLKMSFEMHSVRKLMYVDLILDVVGGVISKQIDN